MNKRHKIYHLLDEFYLEIKEEYPDLELEQVKDAVYGPWRYLKKVMEQGEFKRMRIKYFGQFIVYPGKAKGLLSIIAKKINLPSYQERVPELLKAKRFAEKLLEKHEQQLESKLQNNRSSTISEKDNSDFQE